jgi:hypothetical protein
MLLADWNIVGIALAALRLNSRLALITLQFLLEPYQCKNALFRAQVNALFTLSPNL